MHDNAARIEQFRKMAEADPDNELGHFSLGKALLDAGQHEDALKSLRRVIEINPNISKVYQLIGDALLRQNKRDAAIEALQTGVRIANDRGDMLPRNDMTRMLKDLGAAIPELKATDADKPVGQGEVLCNRCGRVKPRIPNQPFSNAQGKLIYEKICNDCWREWIGMGTKVINELRLPLNDPQAQKVFDQHMMEFLNLQ